MGDYLLVFVQREMEGFEGVETTPIKLLECVVCNWFATFEEVPWTSDRMPESQRSAFFEAGAHARSAHRGHARVVQGWKV